ncbi:coiled-coil domain-containing protein mad1 [Coemansia sp. Benny D115]|nr:coiled-coil domain-containing protein mad1 [Coemansia sp. Benny D115]
MHPGQTPASQRPTIQPPSTAMRSRLRSLAEHPATASRGTKRGLLDAEDDTSASPSKGLAAARSSWLLGPETPVRMSLADSMLRPQRLFISTPPGSKLLPTLAEQSPSRTLLASAQRDSASVGYVEGLRREAERAKFQLRQAEMEREREREEALRTREALERDIQTQTKRVEALERDRRWLFDQEQELAEKRRQAEVEAASQRAQLEARIAEAHRDTLEAQSERDSALRKLRHQAAEHASASEDLLLRVARAERVAAEAQSLHQTRQEQHRTASDSRALQLCVEKLERKLQARDEDVADLQQRLAEACNGAAVLATPSRTRVAQLERDLAEQCTYIEAVEQQNRQLRADVQRLSAETTAHAREKEALQALQAKVLRLEAAQATHAEVQARLNTLEQERAQWRRVFPVRDTADEKGDGVGGGSGGDQTASPFAAAKTVSEQRHTIQMLETRIATLQDEREAALRDLERQREDMQTVKETCASLEAEVSAERRRLAQTEALYRHAEREISFLRTQLSSYDREESTLMTGSYDALKSERIAQLERFIGEQRAWLAEALNGNETGAPSVPDTENAAAADLLRGYRGDIDRANKEAEEARDDYRKLMTRFEALEREAALLEHQVGAGLGYNPRTTRILQLIDNPSAQDFAIRSEKLAALTAENRALIDRIRVLERPGADDAPADAVQTEEPSPSSSSPLFHTISNLRTENESLAAQLDASAKLLSRCRKEWKRKASELREVVYAVLGYRVDFLANGSVRFTSTYAADIDQNFVFTSGDNDQAIISLSGGGSKAYLQGLSNDIRYWVQERGSIPGFMATITLQSFEAQAEQQPGA